MPSLTIKSYHHPRDLKKSINALIWAKVVTNILRYNYVKEYTLDDNHPKSKIKTLQPKILSISYLEQNKDRLYEMLSKLFWQERQKDMM